jgi:GAF domain-containing protein/HAMP domain-containing protein
VEKNRALFQSIQLRLAAMLVVLSILVTTILVVYFIMATKYNFQGQENLYQILSLLLIILLGLFILGTSWWLSKVFTRPLSDLLSSAKRIAGGDRTHRAQIKTQDEIGQLATYMNNLMNQLDAVSAEMRDAAQLDSNEAKKRSYYLEAAAEVGKAASSILETDELIQTVVNLIRKRFNLYYVGLYLLSSSKETATISAGTGDAGKKLVRQGHKIQVGEGLIGWCIANNQARIIQEAGENLDPLAAHELPKTSSEVALPLRSRNQVIGALTVQSEFPGAFDEDILTALETMAGLVAVAIDNSLLFSQSQESLEALHKANRRMTKKAWQDLLEELPTKGVYCDHNGVRSLNINSDFAEQAMAQTHELRLPIEVRGQKIGNIAVHRSTGTSDWTEDEIKLIQKLNDQLSIALESARLYSESQLRAERERLAGEITAKLRTSNDPGTILRTAVQELRLAIQADKAQALMLDPTRKEERFPAGGNGSGSET